jgi:molybdopterin converting factor small subunit
MTQVKVILRPYLSGFAGGRGEVIGSGTTVGEVLRDLGDTYPVFECKVLDTDEGVVPGLSVYLNDRVLSPPKDLELTVAEGDCIRLLPVIGGGAQ